MAVDYSVDLCNKLTNRFRAAGLHRRQRIEHYDPGTELTYEVTGVSDSNKAEVRLVIEKFVGGGFAGQVYRVKVLQVTPEESIGGIVVGGSYAIKILIPPSGFSCIFRNFLYWLGFQGPFQLQCNSFAARAGALWQKFIRRAAKVRFGAENTVVDIHATFVDHNLGSCGELSEWVQGRTWRLEVDDHLDLLKAWQRDGSVDESQLGSPEYRAKRTFMAEFVKILHDVGAHEFARQYEWSTCKSQPNCLKRVSTEDDPEAGLVAVDFRAGLALLPFLPMSPGDFKLILAGLKRGSIVQFDRGNLGTLERFVSEHGHEFADMHGMMDELKACEKIYRNSVPDITHNHVRLLYDGNLWRTIFSNAVAGWKVRNIIDDKGAEKFSGCRIGTFLFFLIGLIPFLGKGIRRLWAHADWRAHYKAMLTSRDYFKRAVQARICEKVITWHRAGRMDEQRATQVAESFGQFIRHYFLSVVLFLFPGLHRFLTDGAFRKEKLVYIFVRPVRLYFNPALREQWLREMVTEGQKKHILSNEDSEIILSRIGEPFIQKYLKSLAVHICTLPVTQIVSVLVAAVFYINNPAMEPTERALKVGAILFLFQIIPISPGSLCRGIYTTSVVLNDRNFRDYNIALCLSYFKYIGYLAFPIQMAYHYPALARFMAGHWATDATHIIPVFGERGALLEHWVFCLFYNWPLTIRRRMKKIAALRESMSPRYWHMGLCAVGAVAVFGLADYHYLLNVDRLPSLREIWWLGGIVPLVFGAVVSLGSGGSALGKRIIMATICGIFVGLAYTVVSAMIGAGQVEAAAILKQCVWRVFVFGVLSTIGALGAEVSLPDPDLK
ncbi:MAG: hypothetical protein ACYTFK_03055 [Planctomycetota bacterium]|jgi:hypothetical protein